MKITEDLRDIRDVDVLNRYLTKNDKGWNGYKRRMFREGAFLINQNILSQIEGFYHYDETRTPTHKSHEVYKRSYSYFRPGPYLVHYLTGGSRDGVGMILQHLPEHEDPVLLIQDRRPHFTYN